MSGHLQALSKFRKLALLAASVGLALLLIGVLSPAWVSSPGRDGWIVEEGIWYSRACGPAGGPCIVSSRDWIVEQYMTVKRHPVYENLDWTEYQILTACSLFGGVVAVTALILSLRQAGPSRTITILIIGGIGSLVACLGTFVPVLKISVVEEVSLTETWSRVVATCGSIVQFVTSILLVFAVSQISVRNIKSKTQRHGNHNMHREQRARQNHDSIGMDVYFGSMESSYLGNNRSINAGDHSGNRILESGESSSSTNTSNVSTIANTSEYSQTCISCPPYLESLPVYTEYPGSDL